MLLVREWVLCAGMPTFDEISAMAEKGLTMLKQAARLVKPGGSLTYATCTLFKEENEQVIEAFLKSEQGNSFSISSQLLFDDLFHKAQSEPLFDTHFVCKLQKDVS